MIMCFLKDIFMNLCLTFRQRACCHLTHLKCCGHQQQWPLNLPRMVPAGSAPRTRKLSSQYKFMITKSRWETFGCHPTVTAWHLGGVWQKPVMQLVKPCHTWDKKKTTQAYDADYKKKKRLRPHQHCKEKYWAHFWARSVVSWCISLHSCGKLADTLMSVSNVVQWLQWQLYAEKNFLPFRSSLVQVLELAP